MTGEETAFPLLPGRGDCYQSAGVKFPRHFTFAAGNTAPLFTSGVVTAVALEQVARLTAERLGKRYGGQRILLIQVLEGGRTFAEMVVEHLRDWQAGTSDHGGALKGVPYLKTVSDHRVPQMRGIGLRAIAALCEQAYDTPQGGINSADVVACDRFEVATIQVRSYGQGSQAAAHRIGQPLRDSVGRQLSD